MNAAPGATAGPQPFLAKAVGQALNSFLAQCRTLDQEIAELERQATELQKKIREKKIRRFIDKLHV